MSRTKITLALRRQVHDLANKGKSLKDIATLLDIGISSVTKQKSLPNPTDAELEQEQQQLMNSFALMPADFDVEEALSSTFNKSVHLLERVVDEVILGSQISDENGRRVPLKTLMDCLDKARTYQATAAKSRSSKNSALTKEAMIDLWRRSAELYMKCKKKDIEYDEKAHIRNVLNSIYGKGTDD